MRICIVGNGPSARGKAEQIDACDFVVRMTGWWISGPPDSGTKLDAYAWFGSDPQSHLPPVYAERYFEHWFTLPPSRCNPPNVQHGGFWQTVIGQAVLRPVRFAEEKLWQREHAALTYFTDSPRIVCPPSTGFTALDMALHLHAPEEILLYGFDATLQGKPGWGDLNPEWCEAHDLYLEKRLIHDFATTGMWLGKRRNTKVIWPDDPIAEEEHHAPAE